MNHNFTCPNCEQPINLETSFVHQVESQLAKKYNQYYADQKGELKRQEEALHQQKLALDVEKRLREERQAIEEKALQKAREESQFHADQQQGLINSMTLQLTEMKRKIEQGAQQSQGEVQEVALEKLLSDSFPFDRISEVPKGASGVDLIHDVRNEFGRVCGRILYESKRTKAFDDSWVDKLKTDQQRHNADIAVLVTEVMPSGMTHFDQLDGVWVCTFAEVRAVATVLRWVF